MEVSDHVPHRTTYKLHNSWVVHEIPAEWLPLRCKMSRLSRAISWDCRVCARNICQALGMSPRVDMLSTCKVGQKLGVSLLCWHATLQHDHPSYCTTEVRNPGGTYELPCMNLFFMKPVSVVKKDRIVPLKLLLYWMFLTVFLWFDVLDGQKAEICTTEYYKTIEYSHDQSILFYF
jgi:hypothetical protein